MAEAPMQVHDVRPKAQADDVASKKDEVEETHSITLTANEADFRTSARKIYSYDSKIYRDAYPLCKAEHRTGLGMGYAKFITTGIHPTVPQTQSQPNEEDEKTAFADKKTE